VIRELRRGVPGRIAAPELPSGFDSGEAVSSVGASAILFGSILCGTPEAEVLCGDSSCVVPSSVELFGDGSCAIPSSCIDIVLMMLFGNESADAEGDRAEAP
jgi:hypothetical protein